LFILRFSYLCFHPHGRLYKILKTRTSNSPVLGYYCSHEVNDIKKKKSNSEGKKFVDDEKYLHKNKFNYKRKNRKTVVSLGLDDFFIYNLMMLLMLQPEWLLLTKILLVFGCIISVQVGYCATIFIRRSWSPDGTPAIPFPVVTFSMYIIIINAIMY